MLEAPTIPRPALKEREARRPASLIALLRDHPVISTGVALVVVSIGLIAFADTRPGYDPYGWLVWGHQTIHLNLDLGGAPSWKPLPWLFTVPYALFGKAELWLWFVTSVTVSLAGVVFAGRIAYRLTSRFTDRPYATIVAGVFAGLSVLGIKGEGLSQYMHYVLSAQSDPMIVTCCLAAIDCHLSKRHRWALALLTLASLGRPEAWPFLGLYTVWSWRAVPETRTFVAVCIVLIPALWFGIPVLSGNKPFVAGSLAQESPRALKHNKVFGTLGRFFSLQVIQYYVLALGAVMLAWIRRDRFTLILAGSAAVWVIVEVAFALHGWPALHRYMYEAAAVTIVLAGVGVGALLALPDRLPRVPIWAGGLVAVALGASLVPAAVARLRDESKDLYHERQRTRQINRLGIAVSQLGGPSRVLYCGTPATSVGFASVLAWDTGINVGYIDYMVHLKHAHPQTVVLFDPALHGWSIRPSHTLAAKVPTCRLMRTRTREH